MIPCKVPETLEPHIELMSSSHMHPAVRQCIIHAMLVEVG